MSGMEADSDSRKILQADHLNVLFHLIQKDGYTIVGPTIIDGAIGYDVLTDTNELPISWTDEQHAGSYRLKKRNDGAFFGYVVGPHSWKKYLHPSEVLLWRAERENMGFRVEDVSMDAPHYALLGVRSCELNAIRILDSVLTKSDFVEPVYKSRRHEAFIVAVNCTESGGTCFCASMKTGPAVQDGYDILLTEIVTSIRHVFLIEWGSERGEAIVQQLPVQQATQEDCSTAKTLLDRAASTMGRELDTEGLADLLQENLEHPRWEKTAERCMACGNCTQVCPTCFCTTIVDTTDLTGHTTERKRRWDSCFTAEFSFVHGGSVRSSIMSRYRQWLTHKLSTWQNQYGTPGCVGCGRCITWCPVGIDITEEADRIRHGR